MMPVIHNNRFITSPFRQGRIEPPAKRKKSYASRHSDCWPNMSVASTGSGSCYQFTGTSETPCLGRLSVVATLPPWSAIHCGDVIICSPRGIRLAALQVDAVVPQQNPLSRCRNARYRQLDGRAGRGQEVVIGWFHPRGLHHPRSGKSMSRLNESPLFGISK